MGKELVASLPGYLYCREKGTMYCGFKHLLTVDWDVPDTGHLTEACVTIAHRSQALHWLGTATLLHPDQVWRVYHTPGGVRAFLVSRPYVVDQSCLELMSLLRCDPLYLDLTRERKRWWCRVSPKPSRPNDYIARYVTTISGEEGVECLECLATVAEHDRLVRHFQSR